MSPDRANPRRSSRDINTTDTLSESQLLPRRPRPEQHPTPTSPNPTLNPAATPSPPPTLTSATHQDTSTSTPPSSDSPSADPATADLPLSLSTSTLLHSPSLPTDARCALASIAATLDPPSHKITVRFHAIGDAPALKQKVAKVSASSTFATVVKFLRKRLYADGGSREGDGLFCYVNSVFAPGLDEGVGNLWRVSLARFSLCSAWCL